MIFSAEQLLSDKQAITATAPSTNIIDLGAVGTPYGAGAPVGRDQGKGNKVCFLVQVTEDFDNLTSLDIAIQRDDNEGFASAVEVHSQTILLADLVAGKQLNYDVLPKDMTERYFRLNYTVTGSAPSAGSVSAGVVMGVQTNS